MSLNTPITVGIYLGTTLLGTILGVLAAHRDLDKDQRERLGLFFFLLAIALPLLGPLVMIVILTALRYARPPEPPPPFNEIHFDEYYEHPPMVRRRFGEGAIREIINNDSIALELRLTALTLLSEHNTRHNFILIKRMLSSRNDELRLLSFSIVDKAEHRLNHRIHQALQELERLDEGHPRRPEALFELAQLYWELVYFELVDEVLTDFLLTEVERYAHAALKEGEGTLRIHILLGRLFFERKEFDRARKHFQEALAIGRAQNRERETEFLVPYLAEIAYYRGEYAQVRELMSRSWHFALNPTLKPLRELWSR
jgi:tetratricopeptide (TPR) repeat protein